MPSDLPAAEREVVGPVVLSRPVRWMWFGIGWIAVALGGIGLVVPGLPSTVFFIVAAWCFSRSSPRFEAWILSLPKVGQFVSDHREGLGMSTAAKAWAIGSIVVFSSVGAFVLRDRWLLSVGVGLFAAVGVVYILLRVPNRAAVIAERAAAGGGTLR